MRIKQILGNNPRMQREFEKQAIEVERQYKLGILSQEEWQRSAKEVAEAIVSDMNNAEFTAWIMERSAVLYRRRELHESKQRLQAELNKFLVKMGTTHEEAERLRTELGTFKDATEAKRWLRKLVADREREMAQVAHTELLARLKGSSPQTTPLQAVSEQTGDWRLTVLQAQARATRGPESQRLYVEGLEARDRRTKIRKFKAAIHEDQGKQRR